MYVSSENQTGKDFGYVAQKQKYAKKLRKLQRTFARRQFLKDLNSPRKVSSKNREKARNKLVVEDLNLKGISKFLRNAKNMNDTSWATFVARLQAKGLDYNCEVIKADRYFPSSQLCSKCGFQYKDLKLSEREWTCPKCGTHHIRDVNAAINLKNYVPLERRKLTPVDSEKISYLAELALQAGTLEEAGTKQQATA